MEVDVKQSRWNPKSVDSALVAAVPRDGNLRGQAGTVQDMGRGWQSWIDVQPIQGSPAAIEWGSIRFWLISINILAVIILVLFLVRRRSITPKS
jgi:hypothetical protein